MRKLLPLIGLLALGACKDEKKAETPPAASTTAPATANPAPPASPAAPATLPAAR